MFFGSFSSAVQTMQTADKRSGSSVEFKCGHVSCSFGQREYFGVRIDHKSVKKTATFPIHLSTKLWKWLQQGQIRTSDKIDVAPQLSYRARWKEQCKGTDLAITN